MRSILFGFLTLFLIVFSAQGQDVNRQGTLSGGTCGGTNLVCPRIFVGYADLNKEYQSGFANVNVRWSHESRSNFSFGLACEMGINFPTIIPYLKIGPELKIFRKGYIDLHMGLLSAKGAETSFVNEIVGFETGYAFKIGKFSLIVEGGVNYVVISHTYFRVPYIAIGFGTENK